MVKLFWHKRLSYTSFSPRLLFGLTSQRSFYLVLVLLIVLSRKKNLQAWILIMFVVLYCSRIKLIHSTLVPFVPPRIHPYSLRGPWLTIEVPLHFYLLLLHFSVWPFICWKKVLSVFTINLTLGIQLRDDFTLQLSWKPYVVQYVFLETSTESVESQGEPSFIH